MEPGFRQFGASGFAMMAGFGDATLWFFFGDWEKAVCRLGLFWYGFVHRGGY